MKRILFILTVTFLTIHSFGQGQFKIRNDAYIQIGYSGYKALTFGQGTGSPNNGNFAIEYCAGCTSAGSGGLNFWKPWPTANTANYLMYIRDNGNVGIGNIGDASAKMWISGNLKVNTTTYTSDLRFKRNVKKIEPSLDNVLKLATYQYNFVQDKKEPAQDSVSVNVAKEKRVDYNFDDKLHFGLIAQDVEKIFPNLVTKDEQGYLALNYTELIPVLIKAVQEQNEKINKLEELILSRKK